jgi:Fe-coproporphyrin III synthase
MNSLVSIVSQDESTQMESHTIHSLPVMVIFPHNQCNCHCVMCDIWRIRQAKEITPVDLERQIGCFRALGVRWVVFSGGEPQLNENWAELATIARSVGTRVTLLTAGLLLESQAELVANSVDDVIVSLDGPPEVHNTIRRTPEAFERMSNGVQAIRRLRAEMPVRGRCTVQKANHSALCATICAAKQIDLTSVSFLAADLHSTAFNRSDGWGPERKTFVALTPFEVDALAAEVERLSELHSEDIESGFVAENADKLRRIVRHFGSYLDGSGMSAPRCNAPWVSTVIEASGDVRPCFFHPVVGNIHRASLIEVLNGPEALGFRARLDIKSNPVCQRCVCSLFIPRDIEIDYCAMSR